MYNKQCPFSIPTNKPYQWSNGIIEIPVTEKQIFSFINPNWWARLQYPQSKYFRHRPALFNFLPGSTSAELNPAIFLIHSWSFLHRNHEGYEIYQNDELMDNFRKFVRRLTLDFDIVTTKDLEELIADKKIEINSIQDIHQADAPPKKTAIHAKK